MFNRTVATVFRFILMLVAGLAVLPGVAVAQQYFDPGLLQKSIDQKPQDYQAPGARLGSFMFTPGVELIYEHNDNVFYLEENQIDDSIFHIRPWANLVSDWNRHAFNVSAWADIAKYSDFGSEDYEDWALLLNGHVDVRRDSYLSYEGSYMRLHEDRRSPDDVGGVKPTDFDYSGLGIGYDHTFNRLKAGIYTRRTSIDYENNIDGDGNVIDNQDRDRDQDALTFRLDYQLQPQRSLFASYAINEVDYDQLLDDNGFDRSSDGYAVQGGMNWDITGVLVGDLYLQYSKQKYDDPRFLDVDGIGLGAGLSWTPTQLTTVNIRAVSSSQETTQLGTSGYFSTLYSARLQHELKRNLLFNARVSYTDNDYKHSGGEEGALSDTEVLRAGVGLTYLFNRNFYLSGGYTYEKQNANILGFEYTANRYFLTLGLEL